MRLCESRGIDLRQKHDRTLNIGCDFEFQEGRLLDQHPQPVGASTFVTLNARLLAPLFIAGDSAFDRNPLYQDHNADQQHSQRRLLRDVDQIDVAKVSAPGQGTYDT